MRFRTTIEIVSDAKDKNEAAEMAGEYLSGNIVSGVEMRCHTRPAIYKARHVAGILTISGIFIITVFCAAHVRPTHLAPQAISMSSAIQPPLKTSDVSKKSADFKKDWQDRQNKAVHNYTKR